MKHIVEFSFTPFPVLDPEYLQRMAPVVASIRQSEKRMEAATGTYGLDRRLMWQRQQARLLRESSLELEGAEADLAMSLCMLDFMQAGSTGALDTNDILAAFIACGARIDELLLKHPLAGSDVDAWILGDLEDVAVATLTDRIREILLDASMGLIRKCGKSSRMATALEWIGNWAVTTGHQKFKWLFAKTSGFIEPDSSNADRLTAITSGSNIDRLQERAEALRKERRRLIADFDTLLRRTARSAEHIVEPIYPVIDGTVPALGLLHILCWGLHTEALCEFCPEPIRGNERDRVLLDPPADILTLAASDFHFWFAGLWNILRDAGATLGFGLRPWAIDSIRECIDHPGRVKRMPIPHEATRTRSVLGKHIAPVLRGHHPDDGISEEMASIKAGESIKALTLLSIRLAGVTVVQDEDLGIRNNRCNEAASWLWSSVLARHKNRVTQWICEGVDRSGELSAVDELDCTANERFEPISDDTEIPVVADLPEESMTFFYVPNPDAAQFKTVPVEIPADDEEGLAMRHFLSDHNIQLLVKPTSLVGALEFYNSMPDMIRAQTPFDDIGSQRWHKLKRGGQRIYVRTEPDGRLLFHPYCRRDWKPNWINHAALSKPKGNRKESLK